MRLSCEPPWKRKPQRPRIGERAGIRKPATTMNEPDRPDPPLRQSSTTLGIDTPGRGLHEITRPVASWARGVGLRSGVLTMFCRHTSASLLIQENADPEVRADLERFFARLVADGDPLFRHRDEGPDDMPAHVRAALTATQLSVPIVDGALALGTWQGIYLWEHRLRPHRREVALHLIGN